MKSLALVAALALAATPSCAPTYTLITKRCPTTTTLLEDFGLTTLGLAVGALKWNSGKHDQAEYVLGGTIALMLADSAAEHATCHR